MSDMAWRVFIFCLLSAAVLVWAWWKNVDPHISEGREADKRGDKLTFRAHDKRLHFAFAFALAFLAVWPLRLWPAYAIILTIIDGIGWEIMQKFPRKGPDGYFSWYDVVAVAMGAVPGALVAWLTFARAGA